MDLQSTQGRRKILPRQPDMQDQTRRAGATLNQFNRYQMPGNCGNGNGANLQSLLAQLINALLARLQDGNQPPPPTPQPVYGAVLPPDQIIQPVYGVVIEPTPPSVQPVYGAVIDPSEPVPVYGAPLI